MEFVFLC